MRSEIPVVILSTADLDAPVWTNKQHIALRLAADHSVIYIDSLGLRTPRLSRKDLHRVVRRLVPLLSRHSSRSKREREGVVRWPGQDRLISFSPVVIPWHGSAIARAINRLLIRRQLISRLPEHYILWTFSPVTYELEDHAKTVIYHSVDLLHTLPSLPREALLAAERSLIARADFVIASSKGVQAHIRAQGGDAALWENVADVELFRAARCALREPRAIFVGNLTSSKVDFGILEDLVRCGVKVALAGPSSIDGTSRDPSLGRLLASGKAEYLGVLSQKAIAHELGRSRVGIIPYCCNEYTSGVFPMKVYEYLAAGLPVVATPLPSLSGDRIEGLELHPRESFAARVRELCAGEYDPPTGDYSNNSWEARIGQIKALLARPLWDDDR